MYVLESISDTHGASFKISISRLNSIKYFDIYIQYTHEPLTYQVVSKIVRELVQICVLIGTNLPDPSNDLMVTPVGKGLRRGKGL